MERFWEIAPKAPPEHFASFPHLERLVVQVLYNRGIRTDAAVEAFLGRRVAGDDPFQMQGMKKAVRRIRQAIQRGERIAVYGDFDADGVTSTAVLVEALHALGAHVAPYIPNRVDEGYGLSAQGLDKIAAKGVSLVITVDCGIRAAEEVEHATRLGLDVIVTDHHALPPVLPNAVAVVNPKQPDESYGFTEFAGVGLAFKLAQALILANEKAPAGQPRAEIAPDDLLDLVALGTVADLAPLLGENRVLVSRGLPALNPPRRAGLRQLLASTKLRSDSVDCETISYFLGPRLNAAGRIEHAETAYRLLRTRDDGAAAELARKLEELNRRRQALTKGAVEATLDRVTDPTAPILVIRDGHIPEGIVGLVASRLVEEFYRPVLVVHEGPPNGLSRGSARSIPEFHITEALDQCGDLLVKHGGHAAAAGFTLETRNLVTLETRLAGLAAEKLAGRELRPKLVADAEVRLELVGEKHVAALEALAPFGERNPEPLFLAKGLEVRVPRLVGHDGKHLQFVIVDKRRHAWQAVAFRQGERLMRSGVPPLIDAVFHLRREQWRGETRLKLVIEDFRSSSAV